MKVHPECFPCFLRQVVIALGLAEWPAEGREDIIKAVLPEIASADTSRSPAHTTTFIHRKVRTLLGRDPYIQIKSEYNRMALGLYEGLKDMVDSSPDPTGTAARLAIAGNVIDFGIYSSFDIEGTIQRALDSSLACDDLQALKSALNAKGGVLYLLDNAGEIVFDRLLIEAIMAKGIEVTAVVKGSPVINDATIYDAREAGLDAVCRVIENGSDAVGTDIASLNDETRELLHTSSVIISKGQANFETLVGELIGNIYYLFQSKCEVVSKELEMPLGSMLLMAGQR